MEHILHQSIGSFFSHYYTGFDTSHVGDTHYRKVGVYSLGDGWASLDLMSETLASTYAWLSETISPLKSSLSLRLDIVSTGLQFNPEKESNTLLSLKLLCTQAIPALSTSLSIQFDMNDRQSFASEIPGGLTFQTVW